MSLRPKTDFVCDGCGRSCHDETYAIRPTNEAKICDKCAHQFELNAIASRDDWTVYGPSELKPGAKIQTWPGGVLGSILAVGCKPHPWTRRGRSFWGERYHCTIKMFNGSIWSGWIGEGLASNVKRLKA